MANTRTLVVAVVALVVGALLGYFYVQSQARDLAGRVTVLESDLAAANDLAGSAAAEAEALEAENGRLEEEVATLRAELEERDQRIAELEAAAGQPIAEEPEAAQDEPETEEPEAAQDEPETEEPEAAQDEPETEEAE